jgi:hypothetical protein
VIDFINHRHPDLVSHYKVFKELFVVCWAGNTKKVKNETYYSRVDIELINEQVRLFYSALDEVSIDFSEDQFKITEYVQLGLNDQLRYYPLEIVSISFQEKGSHQIESELVFEPPRFNKKTLHHIYNSNNALLEKMKKNVPLTPAEEKDLSMLPATYLICFLNDFLDAKDRLLEAKPFLRNFNDEVYQSFKESVRILRKVKYN